MNEINPHPDSELNALFASARNHRVDTTGAQYAFETRLLARLRDARQADSIWAMVSWRLSPLFATCVLALAIWHSHVVDETNDAVILASTDNPETVDLWNN